MIEISLKPEYTIMIVLICLMLLVLILWVISNTIIISKKHKLLIQNGYRKIEYAFDTTYGIHLYKWVNNENKRSIEEVRVERMSYSNLRRFIKNVDKY